MERCARCHIRETEVRLFDAVYDGKMDRICERCSIIENIPVIRKPTNPQIRESEKSIGVYERMKRLVGFGSSKSEKAFLRGDRLRELDNDPRLERPEEEQLDLIDHFQWEITRIRRRKGFSQKQLAELLGESETLIQMVEKGQLPANYAQLIRKLEQFFHIRLRRLTEMDRIYLTKSSKFRRTPVLLNEYGEELANIPEPKIEYPIRNEEIEESKENEDESAVSEVSLTETEQQDFDINNANSSRLRVGDLRELHRRKIEATKQERIEEQRRIEEKQKLIGARKEELRLIREKESKDLDKILGGAELLGKKRSDFGSSDSVREFDDELI